MDYENESESTNMFTTMRFSFNKNIILILEFRDPFYPEASKDSRAIWAGGGGAVGWKPGQRWRPVHGNLAAVRPPHPCPTPVQIRSSVLEVWSSFSRSRRTGPLTRPYRPGAPDTTENLCDVRRSRILGMVQILCPIPGIPRLVQQYNLVIFPTISSGTGPFGRF